MIEIYLIFLLLLVIGIAWVKLKKSNWWKNLVYILAYILLWFIALGFGVYPTHLAEDLTLEKEYSAELLQDLNKIENSYEDLQSDFKDLEATSERTSERFERIADEKKNLKEKLDSIEIDNKELAAYITELESTNNTLEAEIQDLKETPINTYETYAESYDNGSVWSYENSGNDSSSLASSDDIYSECNIKGSVNGIYHTPGSTYYSRTQNVVEWFCSIEDAQDAGYRAPKR